MNNEKLDMILDQIENMSHLKSEDIPSLDLYMDQIMTLFDINLADNKRHDNDKLLTKTMINNYSKEGLLKPIKGKKYTKNHILQMLLIYSLKNTISIQEIKKSITAISMIIWKKLNPFIMIILNITKESLSHDVTTSTAKLN